MTRACIVALVLCGVLHGACTPAEHHEAEPVPAVRMEGFVLPSAVGERSLPESFMGVVVTPDGMWSLSGPGRSLSPILPGAPFPASNPLVPELFDALAERFDGDTVEHPRELVWLIDARVELEVVARALYTASRVAPHRTWLATGPLVAPTLVEISMPRFTGPSLDHAPENYVADLEIIVEQSRVTAVASPRPVGDPPGLAAMGAHYAPEPLPIRMPVGGCHRPPGTTLHDVGQALCELVGGPYALTVDMPTSATQGELLERLVDDPRPSRCAAGPPRLSLSHEPLTPRCEDAVLVTELPARFAAEARAREAEWGERLP